MFLLLLACGPISRAMAKQDSLVRDTTRQLNEVEIHRFKSEVIRNKLGMQRIDISDMALTPRMLGEIDPLKSLKTLPGIGNGGDGNAGLYIRGAEPGHNLIRLNDMTIFNPNHLMGLFSVFNPEAIQHMAIYRGAPPADCFGRISSYIDLQSNWQRPDSTRTVLSLGLLHANAGIKTTLSGSWWLDLQFRKTFMNQTLWPLLKRITPSDKTLSRTAYDLYDININTAVTLKPGVLSLSLYHGGDDFGFALQREGVNQQMDWRNTAVRIKLDRQMPPTQKISYQMAYSHYRFNFGLADGVSVVSLTNQIGNVQGGVKWSHSQPHWRVTAGAHAATYRIHPLEPRIYNSGAPLNTSSLEQQQAHEVQTFADALFQFTDGFSAQAGLSYTYFNGGNRSVSATASRLGYHNLDPTLSLTYQFLPAYHIAASWHRSHQALHFLPLTSSSLPADFWVSSDMDTAPSTAEQAAVGIYGRWLDTGWEAYAEIFDRKMNNLYEYNGQLLNLFDEDGTAGKLLTGGGRSYGIELHLKKNRGALKGYLSYTLSRSFRQFPDIEENRMYPFKYDRPNQFHGVAQFQLNKRWIANAYFTYSDGSNFTPETGRYFLGNNVVSEYGAYHSARLPAYHRLDIGATYSFRNTKRWEQEINISVINLYNRLNALFQYYEFAGQLHGDRPYIQTTSELFAILPLLPSISYTIRL